MSMTLDELSGVDIVLVEAYEEWYKAHSVTLQENGGHTFVF